MGRKIIIAIIVLPILFIGAAIIRKAQTPSQTISRQKPTQLEAADFRALIDDPNVFVLDVHTPEQTHLPGTDAFIPDTQVMSRLSLLPEDKSKPLAVYCRSGNMSTRVVNQLAEAGYTNVYELLGGTDSYKMHVSEVTLSPDSQELGTVIYGDVAQTSYTLTNYTSSPLKINKVSTSCSCTSASIDSQELAPYSTTMVNVKFDPAVHQDDTDLGDLTRTIYIETDNPNFAKLQASFTAIVIKK